MGNWIHDGTVDNTKLEATNELTVNIHTSVMKNSLSYTTRPSMRLPSGLTSNMVRKIQLNSLYGALGNQYFRHYRLDNAEAITLTGQVAIRWIERKINEFMNDALKTDGQDYVIASDTDSIYLNLGPMVARVGDLPSQRVVDVLNTVLSEEDGTLHSGILQRVVRLHASVMKRHW